MTPEEHGQLRADLGSMLRLLGPLLLLGAVLALNIVMHHDTYVGHVQDAYIAPVITAEPLTSPNTASVPSSVVAKAEPVIWDALADCESGTWDRHGVPIYGSANWGDRRGGYEGGVHFAPPTWDAFAPAGFPPAAYLASRAQQVVVAERVLEVQGHGAWPVCGRKVGLR